MRLKLILCGAMLPPALILAGCGMGTVSSVSMNVDSPALSGQAYGGQQPISGAEIEIVEMGTTGYGSTGTVLAYTSTDANGNFSFTHGAYTCPQSDTPLYILAIGGDAGYGNNVHIANAASLGTCTNSLTSYVTINEVTTAALAYSLAHFFTTTVGGSNPILADGDWFGGPSSSFNGVTTYSKGLELGNTYTIPALVDTASGQVATPAAGETIESAKIYTIANILGACVNSNGSTNGGQPCGQLFKWVPDDSYGNSAYDTLQAAVMLALSGYSISANKSAGTVSNLYSLQGTTPAFGGGLTAQPNDFTIGISYTSTAFGLGVDSDTTSTLDIDSSNRIWFPSNLSGLKGAGYFDQASRTFNGPYNGTSMVHPQQVAIDQLGYAWYSDTQTTRMTSYLTTAPSVTQSLSLPTSASNSLTIGEDDRVNVGVTLSGVQYYLADVSADRSTYSLRTGSNLSYPTTSLAGDNVDGNGIAATDYINVRLKDYYMLGTTLLTDVSSNRDGNGQVIFTGNDFIATRPFSNQNGNGRNDGLCIFSLGNCHNIRGGNTDSPFGIAIDGAKNLWLPESDNGGLLEVTPTGNSGNPDGGVYVNSGGGIPNSEYLHDSSNGGTLTTPYGVAIDNEGNVWISNANCNYTGCSATGGFTLTEIIGAGAPTITPVSAQIANGVNLVGTEPTY